ncbi:H/ACA ribonucleoprotein complex non-core subunit NAF1 [Elysia marginata]|uniref:H/ACA ribonucleoprotein complex non-core subunit NAF1 n=1 Tax=Elysia marginata TaxID=1093978 RepID=A0AAV4J2W2_9GAST|nr:H/ACA ribonucleoprotein complex non-core subunit NAF1 [Elysia marginata]
MNSDKLDEFSTNSGISCKSQVDTCAETTGNGLAEEKSPLNSANKIFFKNFDNQSISDTNMHDSLLMTDPVKQQPNETNTEIALTPHKVVNNSTHNNNMSTHTANVIMLDSDSQNGVCEEEFNSSSVPADESESTAAAQAHSTNPTNLLSSNNIAHTPQNDAPKSLNELSDVEKAADCDQSTPPTDLSVVDAVSENNTDFKQSNVGVTTVVVEDSVIGQDQLDESQGEDKLLHRGQTIVDYSDDNDADDNSSSSSSFAPPIEDRLKELEEVLSDDGDEKKSMSTKPSLQRNKIRTEGEVFPEELPPLEYLMISPDESVELEPLGVVSGIVDVLVVVKADNNSPALYDDTILFVEGRKPLGLIFETFGTVEKPYYSVRFNNAEDITEKGIEVGHRVYFAPKADNLTKYVFIAELRKKRPGQDARPGSDLSSNRPALLPGELMRNPFGAKSQQFKSASSRPASSADSAGVRASGPLSAPPPRPPPYMFHSPLPPRPGPPAASFGQNPRWSPRFSVPPPFHQRSSPGPNCPPAMGQPPFSFTASESLPPFGRPPFAGSNMPTFSSPCPPPFHPSKETSVMNAPVNPMQRSPSFPAQFPPPPPTNFFGLRPAKFNPYVPPPLPFGNSSPQGFPLPAGQPPPSHSNQRFPSNSRTSK